MQLGDRMKRYESVSDGYLPSRMPVIVRLDGNSFHKCGLKDKARDLANKLSESVTV